MPRRSAGCVSPRLPERDFQQPAKLDTIVAVAEFSDPAWWPKPPPKPPVHISLPTIILGSLVPVGLIAVVTTLILTQHGHHPAAVRSLAAYDSCLASHGAGPAATGETDAVRRAQRACEGLLPPGTAVGAISPASAPNSAQAQFETCVRNAIGGLPNRGRGGGRFGRGPGNALRAAESVCRSLAAGLPGAGSRGSAGATQPASGAAIPKA